MFGRNVTFRLGRSHVRTLIPEVLALMAEGRFRPELVTTASGALDQAPDLVRGHVLGGSTKTVLSAAP
jgi:alcohol dehydrogenase